MRDIQTERDHRKIEINKVGVKNIRYPITVLDKAKGVQHTVGSVNMYVDLPHRFKGTHMSRFIEILNKYRGEIDIKNFSRDPAGDEGETEGEDGSPGGGISLFH